MGIIRPYMKPVWCAIGEAISTTSSLPRLQPLGIGNDVGHHGVGRVHHALGLAGRARGVDELRDVVGARPVARSGSSAHRVPVPTPGRSAAPRSCSARCRRPRPRAASAAGRLQAFDHRSWSKPRKTFGTISDLGLAVLEHERQLALAEDVHQRVEHGADARAGQVGQRELPPVRQLQRDHVVAADAQSRQARRRCGRPSWRVRGR